jgi:hypothetical protein
MATAAARVVAAAFLALAAVAASASAAAAGGPTYEVRWEVGYMTVAPLGVSQKVRARTHIVTCQEEVNNCFYLSAIFLILSPDMFFLPPVGFGFESSRNFTR